MQHTYIEEVLLQEAKKYEKTRRSRESTKLFQIKKNASSKVQIKELLVVDPVIYYATI